MANENLQQYLLNNELLVDEEQDEEFEPEDDLTDEEIDRIQKKGWKVRDHDHWTCLLYTSPSPRDRTRSRMPSSA